MTLEYLSTQRTASRRPRAALVALGLVVVVLVVIVGVFAWWNDSVRRNANVVLAAAFEDADQRATAGQARVLSTLAYSYPMIWSTSVPDSVRAGLRAVVESSAHDVAEELRSVRADVVGVRILPWQSAQEQARVQVLGLIDAELARFDLMARDATSIGLVMAGPEPSDAAARESLSASGADEVANR